MIDKILQYSVLALKHKRQEATGEQVSLDEISELERLKNEIGESHEAILIKASEEIVRRVEGGH